MIRKSICFLLLLHFSSEAFPQEIFDIDLTDRRIHIGITVSPTISNRTLDSNSPNVGDIVNQRNNLETYKASYNLGASLLIPAGQNFFFETGLHFTDKGYNVSEMMFFWPQPEPNLAISGRAIYKLYFLDIPMLAIFTFGEKNVRFISRVGITANLLLSENEKQIFTFQSGSQDISTRKGSGEYKPFNISPTISVGVDYTFNDHFHFQIAPTGMITLLNTTNTNIKERLWNIGSNIALYCKI